MKNHTPYFAFLIFSRLILSYLAVIFMSILASSIVTLLVPDAMTEGSYVARSAGDMARFTSSALIVVIPILIITSRVLGGFYKNNSEYIASSVKRWLGYITLVLTGGVIVGDLIVFISAFMNGDLGMRLFLKCLLLAIIAGVTFFYYLNDIKRTIYEKDVKSIVVAWIVIVLFLASFIALLASNESPLNMRAYKQDTATINKLSKFEDSIARYYKTKNELPSSVGALSDEKTLNNMPGSNVEYKKVTDKKFELCATFLAESDSDEYSKYAYPEQYYRNGYVVFEEYGYSHEKGYKCFTRTVATNFEKKDSTPIPLID